MKARTYITILISALILASFGASASSEPESAADGSAGQSTVAVEPLDLSTLFNTAFELSPRIAQARAQWQAADQTAPIVSAWPDPSLQFKWFPGTGSYEAELMQMIPNPRESSLRGSLASNQAEIARLDYEKTVRDVLIDIKISYYELGYIARAEKIASINRDFLNQLVQESQAKYAEGSIGLSEMSAAESRAAQAEYEVGLLTERLFSEQANMRSLLGLSPGTVIGDAELPDAAPVDLDLNRLRELVKANSQELAIAGLTVDGATTNWNLAKAQNAPDFSVGLMYESMAGSAMPAGETDPTMATSSRDNNIAVTFGVTIPIWSGKNNARTAQADAAAEASQAGLEQATNAALADTDRLYWQIVNQQRLVELYRDTLIPQALQAADLAQTWFDSGEIAFSELIEDRLVVRNFQLAGARAEADYLNSLAQLERLIGAPLDSSSQAAGTSSEVAQ
jgi:outer membrane protein TolC